MFFICITWVLFFILLLFSLFLSFGLICCHLYCDFLDHNIFFSFFLFAFVWNTFSSPILLYYLFKGNKKFVYRPLPWFYNGHLESVWEFMFVLCCFCFYFVLSHHIISLTVIWYDSSSISSRSSCMLVFFLAFFPVVSITAEFLGFFFVGVNEDAMSS